jgi:hypothetical protein
MEEEEVLGWLYDHTKEPGILASTLVAVFQSQGKATQLLHYLTKKEISSTSTHVCCASYKCVTLTPFASIESAGVIFRGNTLATKCVDAFMKLIGSSYLHRVLKDHIAAISEDKHSCEVDPSKAEKGDNVAHNMAHLRETAEKITEDIFASADLIPAYSTLRVPFWLACELTPEHTLQAIPGGLPRDPDDYSRAVARGRYVALHRRVRLPLPSYVRPSDAFHFPRSWASFNACTCAQDFSIRPSSDLNCLGCSTVRT